MKFEVYRNGALVKDIELCAVCMFGLDRIPFRGATAVSFKKGVIECETRKIDSAGLSLLWEVETFGKVVLSTTRLPQRVRPYILNVELARGKLMEITLKREDWAIFDPEDELNKLIRQGQDLFIQALENINDAPKAAGFADESLKKTLEFSENEVIASLDDIEAFTHAGTEFEAVDQLCEEIIRIYEDLTADRNNLGPLPQKWLQYLEGVVVCR